MNPIKKYIYLFTLALASTPFLGACTDEIQIPDEKDVIYDVVDYSDVPDEIKKGFSLSFRLSLDPLGGDAMDLTTRATGESLREIENFVDLEKLRILFFTCLDDNDYVDKWSQPWQDSWIVGSDEHGQKFHTGKHDVFLFESKSRWVSMLSTAESSTASYQVTTPMFFYGEDDYDFTAIRQILMERPFKIVILANRPERIRYSDFDGKYGTDEFYFGNKGPYWGKEESNKGIADFQAAKALGFKNLDGQGFQRSGIMINELHHCQWDPVYANKNTAEAAKSLFFYDFIISNPNPQRKVDDSNNEVEVWKANGEPDAMGAISSWTKWMWDDSKKDWIRNPDDRYDKNSSANDFNNPDHWYNFKPYNFYVLPDTDQGIPMYGVQQFDKLSNWKEGTPLNLSVMTAGGLSEYDRKNISLLRSLARIDLYIPKNLGTVVDPYLRYSNVFGRCEPMDVATPTDILWNDEHEGVCEYENIYNYGPLFTGSSSSGEADFLKRNAWFYGIWREWGWFPNEGKITNPNTYFNRTSYPMPCPRIYNACIQRNGYAKLDYVRTTEDQDEYYHYVVYTGEKNINDPSKFENLSSTNCEVAFFEFSIVQPGNTQNKTYIIPINPCTNSTVKNYMSNYPSTLSNLKSAIADNGKTAWNYPIMRNHMYSFRVTKINGQTDPDGIDVVVVSSEERFTPTIGFY